MCPLSTVVTVGASGGVSVTHSIGPDGNTPGGRFGENSVKYAGVGPHVPLAYTYFVTNVVWVAEYRHGSSAGGHIERVNVSLFGTVVDFPTLVTAAGEEVYFGLVIISALLVPLVVYR